MDSRNNKWKFKTRITDMSEAVTYEEALSEWEVPILKDKPNREWNTKYFIDQPNKCICSKDIINPSFIRNTVTDHRCIVGCCCINKFARTLSSEVKEQQKKLYSGDKRYCVICNRKLLDNTEAWKTCHAKCYKDKSVNLFIFTFGKHCGKTYDTVLSEDPQYIEWLKRQPATCKGVADFKAYIN